MTKANKHLDYSDLKNFLIARKEKKSSKLTKDYIKKHIDFCSVCWSLWNKARWDVAEGSRGYLELEEFLGDSFYKYFDSSWALAAQWHEKKRAQSTDIASFYKETPHYIYNSLIHCESGDRDDVSEEIKSIVKEFKIKSVIDYGCGVGNDGLVFLENDVFTHFIDFNSPSTEFLKWRINKRGHNDYIIYDVESLEKLPQAEMLWSFDVFEHMKSPEKIIDMIHDDTRLIVHESENDDEAGGRHPFHFGFDSAQFEDKLKEVGFKKKETDSSTLKIFYRD